MYDLHHGLLGQVPETEAMFLCVEGNLPGGAKRGGGRGGFSAAADGAQGSLGGRQGERGNPRDVLRTADELQDACAFHLVT